MPIFYYMKSRLGRQGINMKKIIIGYKATATPGRFNALHGDGSATSFHNKHTKLWDDFQAWLDNGNTPEPHKTESEAIAKARFNKKMEIIKAFDNEIKNGFKSSTDICLDIDPMSVASLTSVYTASKANDALTIVIGTADNNVLELVLTDFEVLFLQMFDYVQKLYQKKWEFRNQINAADDIEAINAIEWNGE